MNMFPSYRVHQTQLRCRAIAYLSFSFFRQTNSLAGDGGIAPNLLGSTLLGVLDILQNASLGSVGRWEARAGQIDRKSIRHADPTDKLNSGD